MKKSQDTDLSGYEEYYRASSDWFYDMYQSHSLWLRRAIIAVIVLAVLLAASIVTNLFLFPLKQKVPYLYTFDKSTGEVSILGELKPSEINNNWQMTRFFLHRYVVNRESYDFDNIQYPYQIAWAMSAGNIRTAYDAVIFSDQAPYKLYGKDKFISVKILSISKLNDDTASVRFEQTLTDKNSTNQQVSQKEAIVKWKYDPKPETQKILDRDPLGFLVTYYRVSQVNQNT